MFIDIFNTDKKYSIIYADPPWHYKNYADNTASRWVGNQYPVMSIDDISNLPVRKLTATGCVLFLWVTAPCLLEGIEVMKAWGFEYKTKAFCWVKMNRNNMGVFTGMGYYTRSNSEDCLLCVKGNPLPRLDHSISQVILHPVMEHSKKPSIARDLIVRLFGELPRIELFARQQVEGWDCWGWGVEEVAKDIDKK